MKLKHKLCFISSSGGHFNELTKLTSLCQNFDSFLVVEKTPNFKTNFCKKNYFVNEINRKELFFLFKYTFLSLKELFIFIKERPSIVVSTGALCAYPMIRIAKFFKAKIIYIESYARISDLSTTGKKVIKYADLFFVQWRELAEKYEKTIFVGSLFGEVE